MAVFSTIRGALQQNEAIIMCKKIGIIQTSVLTNTHGVVGMGMLLGRGRSQNAPQLGEDGQELLVPISTLSMREGVSQIWLTVEPAWRKMLTNPTVLVQVALRKSHKLMFLIALHPCRLLFDRCFHSPSSLSAVIFVNLLFAPLLQGWEQIRAFLQEFFKLPVFRGSTLGWQLKLINSIRLFSPFLHFLSRGTATPLSTVCAKLFPRAH